MGNNTTKVDDDAFLEETKKENFILSVIQCKLEDPMQFNKEALSKRKNCDNFVIMTGGSQKQPKLWHSSEIRVFATTFEDPPIEQYTCCFYQFHSQLFMAIHVDPSAFYHICFFMNRCRFFCTREEFLNRVLKCKEENDPILCNYITPITSVPNVRKPVFGLTLTKIGEDESEPLMSFESSSALPNADPHAKPMTLSQKGSSSSFRNPVSEPDSINIESAGNSSSSIFGAVSEPSTHSIKIAEKFSSVFGRISEPNTYYTNDGLTQETGAESSFFGPVSDSGSGLFSTRQAKDKKDLYYVPDDIILTNTEDFSEDMYKERDIDDQYDSKPLNILIHTYQDTLDSDSSVRGGKGRKRRGIGQQRRRLNRDENAQSPDSADDKRSAEDGQYSDNSAGIKSLKSFRKSNGSKQKNDVASLRSYN